MDSSSNDCKSLDFMGLAINKDVKQASGPRLVNSRRAAEMLGKSPDTLKRWRWLGVGPDYVDVEGSIMYDLSVLEDYVRKNTRVPSVRAALENTRGSI